MLNEIIKFRYLVESKLPIACFKSTKLKLSLIFFLDCSSKLRVVAYSSSFVSNAKIWDNKLETTSRDKFNLYNTYLFLFKSAHSVSFLWLDGVIANKSTKKIIWVGEDWDKSNDIVLSEIAGIKNYLEQKVFPFYSVFNYLI